MPYLDRFPGGDVVRWFITTTDGLIPAGVRARRDIAMMGQCEEQPEWMAAWLGGLVSGVVRSLPPTDPWRNLSARVVGAAGTDDMVRGNIPRPPLVTGAVSPRSGRRFGQWTDGSDLMGKASDDDLSKDVAYAAVADPLGDDAAALIAFAATDHIDAVEVLTRIYRRTLETDPSSDSERNTSLMLVNTAQHLAGNALYEVGTSALRWAMWRRRCYSYQLDPYPVQLAFAWVHLAQAMAEGRQADLGKIEALVMANMVDGEHDDVGGPTWDDNEDF